MPDLEQITTPRTDVHSPLMGAAETNPAQTVEKFRGEHFYMSNMYVLEHGVETKYGLVVPTSEHAYQADRFEDYDIHESVANSADGIKAKNMAHALLELGAQQDPDWDFIKVGRMYQIVTQKFMRNPDIAEKLIATGDMELVEGNYWQDRYWGVCPIGSRDGQNHLGKVLMRVRFDLTNLE